MISSLRRRFLVIAMLSLAGTLFLLCLAINVGYRLINTHRADTVIHTLYQNAGSFPSPEEGPLDPGAYSGFQITQETPFETRYFMVHIDNGQNVLEVNAEHIAALDSKMVVDRVDEILDSGKTSGYLGYYRYGVFQDEDGISIIGLDCFLQLQAVGSVLRITVLASLACIAIVFVLLVLLSRRVVRPFAENLEKQRQFVTDASHELKTPLAIISANTGLLEATVGSNRWLESTQTQITRLDRLIHHLIELARTEEALPEGELEPVDLSQLVEDAVQDFQPLAEAAGETLSASIQPGLVLQGSGENLARLCGLLLDNSVKYCDPGGHICLTLARRGRGVQLTLSNPCAGLDPAVIPKLFDRFYRADGSRARDSGGSGIGLSTARAIVRRHKGKLTARSTGGGIQFTAFFPL